MIDQAVVLVGGLGTRLGSLTANTPKPLLEVAGRPFLHHLLDELQRQGIRDILLLAGFHGEQVERLRSKASNIRVVVEPEPLGTGGALRFAAPYLAEHFFLLNGDSWFDINLWDLAQFAADQNALSLRSVEDVSRFGPATLSGKDIVQFCERGQQSGPGLINGGVSVLVRDILNLIPSHQPASLEGQAYPRLAEQRRLRGQVYDRPFLDIGVPADFARAQSWLPDVLRRSQAVFAFDEVAWAVDGALRCRPDAIARIKAANDAGHTTLVDLGATGRGRPEAAQSLLEALNDELRPQGASLSGIKPLSGS